MFFQRKTLKINTQRQTPHLKVKNKLLKKQTFQKNFNVCCVNVYTTIRIISWAMMIRRNIVSG